MAERPGLLHRLGLTRPPAPAIPDPDRTGSLDPGLPLPLLIYGGCITRDCFTAMERLFPGACTLSAQIARQTFASMPGPPVALEPFARTLTSPFQQRMLLHDARKTAPGLLLAHEGPCLMDFMAMRFDLMILGPSRLTLSGELKHSGFPLQPGLSFRRVKALSHRFFRHWRRGFSYFTGLCDRQGPRRFLLLRAYCAETAAAGWADAYAADFPAAQIRRFNACLDRAYRQAARRTDLFHVIDPPRDLMIADGANRWGLGPFHYIPQFYDHMARSIHDRIARPSAPAGQV